MSIRRANSPVDPTVACMIREGGREYCIDPAGGVADALGKKWTLPLIGVLGNRTQNRFHELAEALDGVGAKALTARLRELEDLGLVRRDVPRETMRWVEYRLTDRGLALRKALVPFLEWASLDGGAPGAPRPTRR
jgi:DNA-binding HxlR family transcriptional regulator